MKQEFAMSSSYGVFGGSASAPFRVRVMAKSEGYAMVRRPYAVPFVVEEKYLTTAGDRSKRGQAPE